MGVVGRNEINMITIILRKTRSKMHFPRTEVQKDSIKPLPNQSFNIRLGFVVGRNLINKGGGISPHSE
jgi:hypothetical protein